jgi:hypothetical protein
MELPKFLHRGGSALDSDLIYLEDNGAQGRN